MRKIKPITIPKIPKKAKKIIDEFEEYIHTKAGINQFLLGKLNKRRLRDGKKN